MNPTLLHLQVKNEIQSLCSFRYMLVIPAFRSSAVTLQFMSIRNEMVFGVKPTAQMKQVSCQVCPRASMNLSPASTGKSQPWHFVLNKAT